MGTVGEPWARHIPVLRDRCVTLLAPALGDDGAVVVDGTLGMGGHAEALLEACPRAELVGIDRDPAALELAGRRLARFGGRVHLVHAVHDDLPRVLADLELSAGPGDPARPRRLLPAARRAPAADSPTPSTPRWTCGWTRAPASTAAEILNTYGVRELTRVLREYGEERFARRIAEAVVRERDAAPFTTSARLVDLVRACIPAPARRTGGNPAKRTFQALRIEVNGELATLERVVPAAVDALTVGGRVVVLAYHSLEDRIVKRVLTAGAPSTDPAGSAGRAARSTPRACAC